MASLPKDEPVLVIAAVGAVVSYALSLLVTHGVISDVQASTLTQQLVPLVAALIPIVLGVIARAHVKPVAKAQRELADAVTATSLAAAAKPGLTDTDLARLQAMLDDKMGATSDVGQHPAIIDPPGDTP